MTSLLYCDGGVIGPNPSVEGATWAWVEVSEHRRLRGDSGVLTPAWLGVERLTNNVAELWAAVEALESAPDGWRGTLFTDSDVTRIRLVYAKAKMNGVPLSLVRRVEEQRRRLRPEVVLLAGHPSRRALERGTKKGLPVSCWNVACDKECRRLAKAFRAERKVEAFLAD